MAEYGNFFTAVDDILAHVRETKHHVECDDEPTKLRIGFRCTEEPGVRWHIRLRTLKEAICPDADETEALLSYLRTVEGREQIAEGFSEGRCIWQRSSPPV